MNILRRLIAPLRQYLAATAAPLHCAAERQLVLQAKLLSRSRSGGDKLAGLHAAEFSAFSQFGEDGIIDWLVEKIPTIPPSFVEFGVQDYRESNTRLLLQLRNLRGLVMDGSSANIAAIQSQDIYWRHDLTAKEAFIDRDNIDGLLAGAGFSGDIGLLSIDIDGNDYWVWEAVSVARPAIVVCEYNAMLGDRHALSVPYRADFERGAAHHSNLYFGASIRALVSLAKRKGYTFVGTTSTGCNGFFVRDDLAAPVTSALDGIWAFPSSVREARDAAGNLTFVSGPARSDIIAALPLVDTQSGENTTLAQRAPASSPEWAAGRGVKYP